MERRQLILQRTREWFGDRVSDLAQTVWHDRQLMRGWEEPAHLRAALRRSVRGGEEGESSDSTVVTMGRCAGEPEPGPQREAVGRLLEAGAVALELMAASPSPDLSAEQLLGLECVLLLHARPALVTDDGQFTPGPATWSRLEAEREDITLALRGVGRIEMFGHPECNWAGSGFLANETTLLTTRRTAMEFAESAGDDVRFRPGISAWMDYRCTEQPVSTAGYRVCSVRGMHPVYDLAVLEVEPAHPNGGTSPTPLGLAANAPENVEGRPVYLISYPVRDSRRPDPEPVCRIFRDVFGSKRVQPGTLRDAPVPRRRIDAARLRTAGEFVGRLRRRPRNPPGARPASVRTLSGTGLCRPVVGPPRRPADAALGCDVRRCQPRGL